MENLLYEYMSKRFSAELWRSASAVEPGPVITISRQSGCGASRIAHNLCVTLNAHRHKVGLPEQWNFINHEILEKAAEKLELEPGKLDKVVTDKDRGIMDQIVEALSSHSHKSDQKIMKTMREVIRDLAEQGSVIIVGRGGAVVSQHIPRSLHIRLEAPREWRIGQIISKFEFSRSYADQYINKLDEQREMYVKRMIQDGKNLSFYDVTLDPSRFTEQQLTDIILQLALIKGIH